MHRRTAIRRTTPRARVRALAATVVGSCLALWPAMAVFAAWSPPPARYGVSIEKDVPITLRDGVVLRADLYRPADDAGDPAPGPFPVLVSETPYGKEFATIQPILTGYESYLVERGYIQAIVDVRGSGASQGRFNFLEPEEADDSVEVIHWAAGLPGSSGRVGMVGASYMGITQLLAAARIGPDSPLKAIFPIVASNENYRDAIFAGGLFNAVSGLALLNAYPALDIVNPLSSAALVGKPADLVALELEHAHTLSDLDLAVTSSILSGGDRAFDETYWQSRSPAYVLDQIVNNGVPAYLVGGLYDLFQRGPPMNYAGLQNAWSGRKLNAPMSAKQAVTGRYQLLMGPWYHTTFPPAQINPIELAWFERWLKDVDTGIDRTDTPLHLQQRDGSLLQAARYPLDQGTPVTLYLASGALAPAAPADSGSDRLLFTGVSQPCTRGIDQWGLGGVAGAFGMLGLESPCDQSTPLPPIEPAALSYASAPFDADTMIAGPIALTLYASVNTADAEWVATLNDLAPNGTAVQITTGALIGSLRAIDPQQSWYTDDDRLLVPYHPYTRASSQALTAGSVTRFDLEINPTFTTVPAGHRLQLVVSTADTPHLLPSAPQWLNLLGGVYAVQRGAAYPSALTFSRVDPQRLTPTGSDTAVDAGASGGGGLPPCSLLLLIAAALVRRRGSTKRLR